MTLTFWFEFASTYSYPAAMRIERLAAERGVAIVWRAFLLGPIFASQGWNTSPFNIFPAKGRYMWRDLERRCAAYGIPFRRPSAMPRNGLTAARVAIVAEAEPWLPEFVRAVYRANFAEDRDIGEPTVIADLLTQLGQPAEATLAAAATLQCKNALRARTAEAEALGIFGAPSFTVGGELFWGDDRLEDALAWAVRPGLRRGEASIDGAAARQP
jgi:2-hydroxychromene-2-carboxylate isomerase